MRRRTRGRAVGTVGSAVRTAGRRRRGTARKQVQAAATAAGAEFEGAGGGGPDAVEVGDDEEGLVERKRWLVDDRPVVPERGDQGLGGRNAFSGEQTVFGREHADLGLHLQRRPVDEVLGVGRATAWRQVFRVVDVVEDETRRQTGEPGDRALPSAEAHALARGLQRPDPCVRPCHNRHHERAPRPGASSRRRSLRRALRSPGGRQARGRRH